MKKYWKWAFLALPLVLLLPSSCDKEPQEEKYEYPYSEPYEKTLWFNSREADSIHPKIIRYFAGDPACTHIYLTLLPGSRDDALTTEIITTIRKELQKRVEISPKVSGRGDWWFHRDWILPADSLWFVEHGWTVNQNPH